MSTVLPFQSMSMCLPMLDARLRVNYERAMITRLNRCRLALRLLARAGPGATLLGAFLAGGSPASADSLLDRCWPPAAIAARAEEKPPIRGAPGHIQANPAQRIADAKLAPFSSVPSHLTGVIRRVDLPKGQKLVALTLDLCEQPGEVSGYDGAIFEVLRREGARATVFAGGKWLMSHPERAQQLIADPLLEMGNHGWAHRNVRGLESTALAQEIRGPQAAYEIQRAGLTQRQCAAANAGLMSKIAPRLSLYRFPYGACNPAALAALRANALLAIQWDISTGDATPSASGSAIAAHLIARIRPGSIVLAHANGRGYHTADALRIAIPKLTAMGYRFVSVGELLAAGQPVIVDTCYDARPGDTDRYDRPFTRTSEPPRDLRPAGQAIPR